MNAVFPSPHRTWVRLVATLCAALIPSLSATAQVTPDSAAPPPDALVVPVDTLTAPPDSLGTPADSTDAAPERPTRPPLDPFPLSPGRPLTTGPLVLTRYAEVTDALADRPGGFLFDVGPPGWLDGWAPEGLPPHLPTVTLDGLPFDDLIDGRPRFDLLPVEALAAPRLTPAYAGAPAAVQTDLRPFPGRPPITEIRFRTGQHGYQSISGVHAQTRTRSLFGRPGRLGVLFRFGGRGSEGGYPNSNRRVRQTLLRVRYAQARWQLELANLHTRRTQGAHGGVVLRGGYDTVYQRFGASVRLPSATHRTQRNDLRLRLGLRWLERLAPLDVASTFTSHLVRFANRPDTLDALAHRVAVRVEQPLPSLFGHHLTIEALVWREGLRRERAFDDVRGDGRDLRYVGARDSASIPGVPLNLGAGLTQSGDDAFASAYARLAPAVGPFTLSAEVARTGRLPSRLDRLGFGAVVTGLPDARASRVTRAQAGLGLRGSPFDLEVGGFLTLVDDPIDYLATDVTDQVTVVQEARTDRWGGATAAFGWRRTTERGLYATAHTTLIRLLETRTTTQTRLAESVPEIQADARLGLRTLLFYGDLDLDVFLRVRSWTAARFRTFHPQTTLLTLPPAEGFAFDPAGILDLYLEAGIRTATVYVQFENVLSGLAYPGVTVIPVYPLPETAFRLGVYWPFVN